MALDKTKENTRIADLLAMSEEDISLKMLVGINNPSIFKQFILGEGIDWNYAVSAGLLSESDVEWIKEHVNEVNSEIILVNPEEPADELPTE